MRNRVRYFKMIEIDRNTFVEAAGEDLGFYSQLIDHEDGIAYIAVNVRYMEEISVPLDTFDSEVNGEAEKPLWNEIFQNAHCLIASLKKITKSVKPVKRRALKARDRK